MNQSAFAARNQNVAQSILTVRETAAPQPILNLTDAVALIVGIVVGAGIFRTPSLVGALCYAELATAFPNAGGDYPLHLFLARSGKRSRRLDAAGKRPARRHAGKRLFRDRGHAAAGRVNDLERPDATEMRRSSGREGFVSLYDAAALLFDRNMFPANVDRAGTMPSATDIPSA